MDNFQSLCSRYQTISLGTNGKSTCKVRVDPLHRLLASKSRVRVMVFVYGIKKSVCLCSPCIGTTNTQTYDRIAETLKKIKYL